MEIQFLGVGGAFDFLVGNSAAILTINQQKILIDCGHTVYPALRQHQLSESIDAILITHLHDDHAGSLSTFCYHQYFLMGKKAKLLYPEEIFREELYQYLCFSMQTPEKFVDFVPISTIQGIEAIDTYNKHSEDMQSYSYIFVESQERIVYSGDIGDCDFLLQQIKPFDGKTTVFMDTCFYPGVKPHAYYLEIAKWLDRFTIFGYHNNPEQNPSDNPVPLVWHQPQWRIG